MYLCILHYFPWFNSYCAYVDSYLSNETSVPSSATSIELIRAFVRKGNWIHLSKPEEREPQSSWDSKLWRSSGQCSTKGCNYREIFMFEFRSAHSEMKEGPSQCIWNVINRDEIGTKSGWSRDEIGTKSGRNWDEIGTKSGWNRDVIGT